MLQTEQSVCKFSETVSPPFLLYLAYHRGWDMLEQLNQLENKIRK